MRNIRLKFRHYPGYVVCYKCPNPSLEWWNRALLRSEHSLCTHFQCGVRVQDGYDWRKMYCNFKFRQNYNRWCNTVWKYSCHSDARYFHYDFTSFYYCLLLSIIVLYVAIKRVQALLLGSCYGIYQCFMSSSVNHFLCESA